MMLQTSHRRPASLDSSLFRKVILTCLVLVTTGFVNADDQIGIRVPDGFEATIYADNDLATDIYSMTVDSLGRVVVSGPGYVRILIDSDNDGRADTFKQYADGPASGAQGMYFDGRNLICTGDQGLLKFTDADGDDQADGPPEVMVKLKAGGEHDAHAVRRGADGWWYVISGNHGAINEQSISLDSSPVRRPRHGTVLRINPDFSGTEVLAHGYRNAYDFDFSADGDLLTFESDGEREISLPAYMPTRVFHAAPGSHAGWMSDHWKRPNELFDMPPVVADFGRGSPTGVVTYRHTQFPKEYHGSLFVMDWTFGRIFCLPMSRDGSAPASPNPAQFVATVGENGFAPTDIEVGSDGSLFVSIGGRGTRGAVYRIRSTAPARPRPATNAFTECLDAPQPLSSWSRALWEPVARQYGAAPFARVALDERQPDSRRVRAIEILTDLFEGVDAATGARLTGSRSANVRARLAWSLGRTRPNDPLVPLLQALLRDQDPFVQRMALETSITADAPTLDALAPQIGHVIGSPDRFVRMAAVRVLARMSRNGYAQASNIALTKGPQATVYLATAYSHRQPGYQPYSLDVARLVLESTAPDSVKTEAARLMQIGLGDVGAIGEHIPEAFEGYTSRVDLSAHAEELTPLLNSIASVFPTQSPLLDRELGRVVAMLQPSHPQLLKSVLGKLTADSDPVSDVHWLIVAARMNTPRDADDTAHLAKSLLRLESKIREGSRLIDTHWDEQINEIHTALVDHDPNLPVSILKSPEFGRPAHISFVDTMPEEFLEQAVAAFVNKSKADPDYPWNEDLIYLLSQSESEEAQKLIRDQFHNNTMRIPVIFALSDTPKEEDRELYLAGLENTPTDAMEACINSLLQLPPNPEASEQLVLMRTMKRLGDFGEERSIRDRVVERLEDNLQLRLSYQPARNGLNQQAAIDEWVAAIRERFPAEYEASLPTASAEHQSLAALMAQAEWTSGDPARGRKLFENRSCAQCHSGRGAIGPDLRGVAQRFSRDDLFTAIADPSRDVSPRYQTTAVVTDDGQTFNGVVIFESIDYLVLRNASNKTNRLDKSKIEEQKLMSQSLMPNGLLKDLGPSDLADLYSYLRQMGTTSTATSPEAGTTR